MKKYLQMIIEHYQKNLEKHFPQEKLGLADRLLFNRTLINVTCKFSSFNEDGPIICGNLPSGLDIMKEYGFNVNFNYVEI